MDRRFEAVMVYLETAAGGEEEDGRGSHESTDISLSLGLTKERLPIEFGLCNAL